MSDESALAGETVVVIGGSSGIGLEAARRAREDGAEIIITARDADRVHRVGLELGASIAAFDATNFDRLGRFFDELPAPVDHVLVACPRPSAPADFDLEAARRSVDAQLLLPLQVARVAGTKIRRAGTLLFTACTDDHRPTGGLSLLSGLGAALPALTKTLALEIAPVRVNLIVRTAQSTRRVVAAGDVAALAVHLMTNTAVTGATFAIEEPPSEEE